MRQCPDFSPAAIIFWGALKFLSRTFCSLNSTMGSFRERILRVEQLEYICDDTIIKDFDLWVTKKPVLLCGGIWGKMQQDFTIKSNHDSSIITTSTIIKFMTYEWKNSTLTSLRNKLIDGPNLNYNDNGSLPIQSIIIESIFYVNVKDWNHEANGEEIDKEGIFEKIMIWMNGWMIWPILTVIISKSPPNPCTQCILIRGMWTFFTFFVVRRSGCDVSFVFLVISWPRSNF